MAPVDEKALIAEVDSTIVSDKGNYCPIVIRNAWHASGTFDKADSTGGSDGATMRFEPELSDRANVGLTIVHDLLAPIKEKFPDVSLAIFPDVFASPVNGGTFLSAAPVSISASIQLYLYATLFAFMSRA